MFKILRHLLLGHKHNWQYYLARDTSEQDAYIQVRYCHNCKKWQVYMGQGRYVTTTQKPHYVKGVLWL